MCVVVFAQYLHNEKKLLHGDMKSCNVVIKGDFDSIKICDVGVSLPLDENMQGKHFRMSFPFFMMLLDVSKLFFMFFSERSKGPLHWNRTVEA